MTRPLVEISGFNELVEKIKLIADDKKKKQEMLPVLRKAAQGTVKVAKRNSPVSLKPHVVSGKRTREVISPGNLRKSIGVITGKKGFAKDNPVVYVGPRAKGMNKGWYGHFVEYGVNLYRKGFKRKHTTTAKAQRHNASGVKKTTTGAYFMKRTFDETKGQVTAESAEAVAKYIQKKINALSR